MANITIFRINYKSDFILTLNSDAGWMTPFCIKFWTGAPSRAYFVSFDGITYTHCAPVDGEPTKLLVQFDDHHLPIGDLKFQIAYHFTVADFPTSVEDEVLNQASVIIEVDDVPAQVMLDLNGETAPEIEFSLPAYANEAQRIANEEQRIANEEQRIANEEARIAAETIRQQNEAQRISNEESRVTEFARLKQESETATADANAAATLANEKAALADDKAALADAAATLANEKAQLAADKAALAQAASTLANEKAALAQQKAAYAQTQGDYAKAQGDTAQADHVRAEADHTTAADDHSRAEGDHTTAASDHSRAESDHTTAASDHSRAESDHTTAASDHSRAESDHTTAASDHTRAESDHTTAASDHETASSDHTRAESDHAAVEVYVDSLGVFDLSKHNAVGGVLATYSDLSAALTALNALESKYKYGGMSIKFVQSSDNKYVQFRYMETDATIAATFTNTANWQGVDSEPTAGSDNLIKSGGVNLALMDAVLSIEEQISKQEFTFIGGNGTTKTKTYEITGAKRIRIVPITKQWNIANLTNALSYFWINAGERQIVLLKKTNNASITSVLADFYDIIPLDGETSITVNVRGDIGEMITFNIIDYNYDVNQQIESIKETQESDENNIEAVKNIVFEDNDIILSSDLEQGGINFSEPISYTNTNRIRTKQGKKYFFTAGTHIIVPRSLIPFTRWGFGGYTLNGDFYYSGWISADESIVPNAGYYIFLFDTTYSQEKANIIVGTKIEKRSIYNIVNGNDNLPVYYGKKVELEKTERHHFVRKVIYEEQKGESGNSPMEGLQSSAIANEKLFCFLDSTTGVFCRVYNLSDFSVDGEILKTDDIPTAHNNGSQDTPYYYDSNDEFPLIAVSSGVNADTQHIWLMRFIKNNSEYSCTVVQDITITGIPYTVFGTAAFDFVNNVLYFCAYKNSNREGGARIYVFENPVVPGNYQDVILGASDVKREIRYDVNIRFQDLEVVNGKILILVTANGQFAQYGFSGSGEMVAIINGNSGEYETFIPLQTLRETEGVSYYNKKIYVTSRAYPELATGICFNIQTVDV